MQPSKRIDYIKNWISDYCKSMPKEPDSLVIGISGGIDSAVTSTLCAKTGLRILCLDMPIRQNLSEHSRAQNHIKWLKEKFGKSVYSNAIDLSLIHI